VTEQNQRRWRLLEDWPALSSAGWLPPAEDVPALADLRETHLRILAAEAETSAAAGALARTRKAELEAVRAAGEEALLSGKAVDVPSLTVTDAEMAEARAKAEAARDALQTFVMRAAEEAAELAPEITEGLRGAYGEAAAKRAEAQALLAEADDLEKTPRRVSLWLQRITGQSKLGHFPYDQMVAPAPPEPLDMEAALAGGTFTEVEVLA
jgi:hypothetical protein